MTATDLTAFDAEEQRLMTLTERRTELAARQTELRSGIRRGMYPAAELDLIERELAEVESEIADLEHCPGLLTTYPALRWAGADPHLTYECCACNVLLLSPRHRGEKGKSAREDGAFGLPAVAMMKPDPAAGGRERPICAGCEKRRAARKGRVGAYTLVGG